MRENIKRSMIVKTSRIKFLEAWARKLPSRSPLEIRHAVEVFAQVRFGVSKRTARKYAEQVMQLLNLAEEVDACPAADKTPRRR